MKTFVVTVMQKQLHNTKTVIVKAVNEQSAKIQASMKIGGGAVAKIQLANPSKDPCECCTKFKSCRNCSFYFIQSSDFE